MTTRDETTITAEIRNLQQEMFELKQGYAGSKLRIQQIQQIIDQLIEERKQSVAASKR